MTKAEFLVNVTYWAHPQSAPTRLIANIREHDSKLANIFERQFRELQAYCAARIERVPT